MSKIMSVFEKLNLVEKSSEETATLSGQDTVTIQEKVQPKNIRRIVTEAKAQSSESLNASDQAPKSTDSKQKSKLSIKEIYELYDVENSNINTIFMLGNFINALPENLPYEIRKKSLINILTSSNTDLKNLLSDGTKRLDVLNEFSTKYSDSTTNKISGYSNNIIDLKKQISTYEKQIKINEDLLKEQNNVIKYEAEKINSIIDFFNNAD